MTIKGWISSTGAVLVGWLGLQLLVMYFTDAAPGAVVLFPSTDFVYQLPIDVAVVGVGTHWIALKSDAPNLGKSLYRAGGWVVLPAGLSGCLPLG